MSTWPSSHRYMSVSRQMERVSNDHERRLRHVWVERVLHILDTDNLIAKAASLPRTEEGLLFECNFAPEVWDDPRITFRIKQLDNHKVTAELTERESTIAGKTFKRSQIRVTF